MTSNDNTRTYQHGDRVVVLGDSPEDNMLGTYVGTAIYANPDWRGFSDQPRLRMEGLVWLDEPFHVGGRAEHLLATDTELVEYAPWYVNVYEIDRGYGGPEEGGWYYDIGTPVFSVRALDKKLAEERAARLREVWSDESDRPVSSVLYSGGCYAVYVQNHEPCGWPTERPHYE